MKTAVNKYPYAVVVNVELNYNGNMNIGHYNYSKRWFENKLVAINSTESMVTKEIYGGGASTGVSTLAYSSNFKLWVDPEVNTQRALIRNSGYKIVRDRENADYMVCPDIDKCQIVVMQSDKVAIGANGDVYFVRITDRYKKYNDDMLPTLKDSIEKIFSTTVELYDSDKGNVFIGTRSQLIRDILDGEGKGAFGDNELSGTYIQECYLQLKPLSEICVDTLEIWSKIDDDNILIKQILASDWRKYPLTLSVFLKVEAPCLGYGADKKFKSLLTDIKHYNSNACISNDAKITPDDWAMLQKWIMHKLMADEENASYVDFDRFSNLSGLYKNFVKKMIVVKPVSIENSISGRDDVNLIVNT